ncbi:hypothetical protein [Tardiphaga sp.]|uniref:hypothetical protein n=1 Tax=Tardiphaga sp. TaxID=1926292 RepID=UPI0026116BC3|nr:hypothetical protein [Tardiphaga sp.]MDB5620858.1 hypothetical protein [Tardiphaga sp.]
MDNDAISHAAAAIPLLRKRTHRLSQPGGDMEKAEIFNALSLILPLQLKAATGETPNLS